MFKQQRNHCFHQNWGEYYICDCNNQGLCFLEELGNFLEDEKLNFFIKLAELSSIARDVFKLFY